MGGIADALEQFFLKIGIKWFVGGVAYLIWSAVLVDRLLSL